MFAGKGASGAIEVSSAGCTRRAGRSGEAIGVPGFEKGGGDGRLDRWRCTIGSPHWATTPGRCCWPLGPARAGSVVVGLVGCNEDAPGIELSVPPASPVCSGRRWTLDAASGALRTAGNGAEVVLRTSARPIGVLLLTVVGDWPDAGAVLELLAWTIGTLLLIVVGNLPGAGAALELPAWAIGTLLLIVVGGWPDVGAVLEVRARPIDNLLLMVIGSWQGGGAVIEVPARTIGMLLMSIGDLPDTGDGLLATNDWTSGAGGGEADSSFGRASERCAAAGVREPRTTGSDSGSAGEACMLVLVPCTSTSATTEGWSSGAGAAPIGVVPRPGGAIASRAMPAAMERVTPIGALYTAVDCANGPAAAG